MAFSFEYVFDGRALPSTLFLQENAHVISSGNLRLTQTNDDGVPFRESIGRVIHSPALTFNAQVDFRATLKFYITSVGSPPADGLTFFIAPVGHPIPDGSVGGNFGIFNPSGPTPHVFAVEFDTNKNSWDPDYRHVGIDIESSVSKAFARLYESLIGQDVTAVIQYTAATKEISVQVTAGTQNYEFGYVHDLGTVLTQRVQVGISASTGQHVAVHDVSYWSFTTNV